MRRRSLDAVAGALGIGCTGRHRALPDARIAAEILCVFLERAAARGIARLDQLIDLQRSAVDGRPFVSHIPRERLADVPARPGVYHLLDGDGRLLYVGKAARLRERLAAYLANARGHSPRVLDLIRHARDFRIVETGSELAASLLEARHIRELKPPYNRQRKHLPRVAFLKLNARGPWPRLGVTTRLAPDRGTYVGPFRSVEAAERAQAVLGRLFGLRTCPGRLAPSPDATPCLSGQVGACSAPCAARIDAASYGERVASLLAFVDGDDDGPVTTLTARRDRLAGDLRFEAAARAQRDLELLEDVRRRRRTLSWVVARQNFVVLLPTVDRDAALVYVVLAGRLAMDTRVTATADLGAVVRFVRERFEPHQGLPLRREDVDGTTILAAWLRDRGAHDGILLPLDGPEAIVERLDELAVTVRDIRARGPLPRIEWGPDA
jgi:DNA polymerase-3 subunit epsilon